MTGGRAVRDRLPAGLVVVVHGPAHPNLDLTLRQAGLVPVHEIEGAVIWATPPRLPTR